MHENTGGKEIRFGFNESIPDITQLGEGEPPNPMYFFLTFFRILHLCRFGLSAAKRSTLGFAASKYARVTGRAGFAAAARAGTLGPAAASRLATSAPARAGPITRSSNFAASRASGFGANKAPGFGAGAATRNAPRFSFQAGAKRPAGQGADPANKRQKFSRFDFTSPGKAAAGDATVRAENNSPLSRLKHSHVVTHREMGSRYG